MQVCQGQAQEEQRGGTEGIEGMPLQESAGEQQRWKGKDPVINENLNPLGEIGPHESAFIMSSNYKAMLEVEKEVNERAELLF